MALGYCAQCDWFYDEADGVWSLSESNRVTFVCDACDQTIQSD